METKVEPAPDPYAQGQADGAAIHRRFLAQLKCRCQRAVLERVILLAELTDDQAATTALSSGLHQRSDVGYRAEGY